MEKVVRVSEAEMEVMEMLWDQEGTIKQSQLLALFEADGKVWKRQTINTFLSRLEDKGLIKRENRMVEPLYSREEYGGIQIKAMIDWMYRGKLSKSILMDVDEKVDVNICRGCEKDVELMIRAETEHLRDENETLKKRETPAYLIEDEGKCFCPKCRMEIVDTVKYCPNCGHRVMRAIGSKKLR